MKSEVVVTNFPDCIELHARLMQDDYPKLDDFDRAVVKGKVEQPADLLQSMEILIRRATEQGLLK